MERLGSQGGSQVMRHRFFADIDWSALNRREINPPFDPCRQQALEDDATNFEKEFTSMPLHSMEEISPMRSRSDDTFSNFTYEEESYLDRRRSLKSPEMK